MSEEPPLWPTSSLPDIFSSHSDLEIQSNRWALRVSPKDTSPSPILVPHCPGLPRIAACVSVGTVWPNQGQAVFSDRPCCSGIPSSQQWRLQCPAPCHVAGAGALGYAGPASLTLFFRGTQLTVSIRWYPVLISISSAFVLSSPRDLLLGQECLGLNPETYTG